MLNKLYEKLGIGAYFVENSRKKEIKAVAKTIKQKYSIPPVTETTLETIARDYKIEIFRSDLVLAAPAAIHKRRQIIIPRYPCLGSTAHEIGHLVLNTIQESEADYFMGEIIGEGVIKINYSDIKDSFFNYRKVAAYVRKHPYHLVDEATSLKRRGVGVEEINMLISEIRKWNPNIFPPSFTSLEA